MRDIITLGVTTIGIIAVVQVALTNVTNRRKINGKVSEIMAKDGLSFEDARDKLLVEKIAKIVEVEHISSKLGEIEVRQGDRISFLHLDDKVYITGDFVGAKDSMADGYSEHICIRTDNKILYTPVEVIDLTTLKIYER
jgi:hypothetical protein